MKKRFSAVFVLMVVLSAGASAANIAAGSANGMTLNGATGLVIVPDARIAWEQADIGLDIGYGVVRTGGRAYDHMPRFALSIYKRLEISGLLHLNQNIMRNFVVGGKFQLYGEGGTALALGSDFEFANRQAPGSPQNSSRMYMAATYGGDFFGMPAVTSATIGWQFWKSGQFSSQFLYGMGFSLSLLPDTFRNFIYWVSDFSNFSYTVYLPGIDAASRGAFNTGIRIHPVREGRFNLVIDIIGTDLLDDGQRGFYASISGGLAFDPS